MMQPRKIAAGALLVLLLTLAAGPLQASPWREDRPITVGHRGTRLLEDENTLEAYALAADYGVDVVECDPKLTADGVYVIMHDSDVDRTTNGSGKVADLTLAQIKDLRTEHGHQVPTLREVLDLARERNMGVYLDLKDPPADGGVLLNRVLEETSMVDRVIVGCYHVRTLVNLKKINPRLSFCISWPYPVSLVGARLLGAEAVGTLTQLASPAMVSLAHSLGLKVITMPINDAGELAKFAGRGLDGLQSDDPRLLEPYGQKGQ